MDILAAEIIVLKGICLGLGLVLFGLLGMIFTDDKPLSKIIFKIIFAILVFILLVTAIVVVTTG